MAISINGSQFSISAANDSVTLNCPIKKIKMLSGSSTNLFIDDLPLWFSQGVEVTFPNLKGYPGTVIKAASDLTGGAAFLIEEIGDVLNPNYFNEDIRNWNGQGAVASEAEASPKKAAKAKKAEVTE